MSRTLLIFILSTFGLSSCTYNKYFVQEPQPSSFLYSNDLPNIPSFEDSDYNYYEEKYYVTPIDEQNAQEQMALARTWNNSIASPTLNWSIGFQAFPYAFSPCGYNPYGLSLGVSFGNPWLYDPWQNPYMTWRFRSLNYPMFYSSRFWSPFYPDPFYAHNLYDPFCNRGSSFGFYDPFYYDPFLFSSSACPAYFGHSSHNRSGNSSSSNTGIRNQGYRYPISPYTVIKIPNTSGNGGSNETKTPTKPKFSTTTQQAVPPSSIAISTFPGVDSPEGTNQNNQVFIRESSENQKLKTPVPAIAKDPRFSQESSKPKNYSYSRPVKTKNEVKKYSSSFNHQKNTTEQRGNSLPSPSRQPAYNQPTYNRPAQVETPNRSYWNTPTPSRNQAGENNHRPSSNSQSRDHRPTRSTTSPKAQPSSYPSRSAANPSPSKSNTPRTAPSRPSARPTPSRPSAPKATPSRPSSRPTPSRPSAPRTAPSRPSSPKGSGVQPR